MVRLRAYFSTLCVFGVLACSSPRSRSVEATDASGVPEPGGVPEFCARPGADQVRDLFCGETPVGIGSLGDLQRGLSLTIFDPAEATGAKGYSDAATGSTTSSAAYEAVTVLGHSTALSGRVVSPINPRAIILGQDTFLAFNRGVQQVELVSIDRNTTKLNFYLVTFEQACNRGRKGCKPGDLFTPRLESDWQRVQVRDAEELKNTPSDCRQCHQRGTDESVLLMRELHSPWTHFFAPQQTGSNDLPEATGSDLLEDYLRAKGNETYAGIPSRALLVTLGFTLEGVVRQPQPLVFDGTTILNERWPYGPNGFARTPARSATWYSAYEAFKRGEQLELPYFDPRATDEGKQAKLTAAYQRYAAQPILADDLPDLGDIFPDDPQVRAEMGLQTEPGATAAQALVQACGACHNDVLDQSVSRARFSVALSRMSRAELDVAVSRLEASRDASGAMPPRGFRELDDDGRKRLIDYLKKDVRSTDEDALLDRAALLGMAGGAEN